MAMPISESHGGENTVLVGEEKNVLVITIKPF